MRHTTFFRIGMVLAMIIASDMSPALAADKGKDPSKRLQQQLRMAEQEKTKLAQEKAEVEGKLKEAEGKLTTLEKTADAAAKRSAKLSKELESTREELTLKLKDAEKLSQEQQRNFEADKRRMEQEKRTLDNASARQLTALAGCRERNERMYKLGNELLDSYEQKNCWSAALQAEPFTGLKRAQIEKMVEEDREKLDKDQLLPDPAAARVAIPATASPSDGVMMSGAATP